MKYGLELEFFVLNDANEIIPAYKATTSLDGDPVIGELRTGVHSNMVDAVFEMNKLLFLERKSLRSKGFTLALISEAKLSKDVLKSLRKDKNYVNSKQLEVLEEKSIYGKSTGKILPIGVYKASLQINISDSREVSLSIKDSNNNWKAGTKEVGDVFDYISIISEYDKLFKKQIANSKRVAGVYAIKNGINGKRIEYRSLPNTIELSDLL